MISATAASRSLGVIGVIGFMALATTSSIATSGGRQDPADAPVLAPFEEPSADRAAIPAPPLESKPRPRPETAEPVDAAPVPREPEPVKELPAAPEEPALDVAPATQAPKPQAATAEEGANPLPPARELDATPVSLPAPALIGSPAPSAAPARRSTAVSAEPAADDPDARARSFVERNRKEADDQLKALREEAAQLRTRLGRVEAGIRRWESLADALDRSSQDRAAVRTPVEGEAGLRGRTRGGIQYVVPPGMGQGVIIQSQPVTRADFVPAPLPR